ncbi:hypothetical protein [Serratia inhibens]|uniref:hypothetical protein n=1 Tax=Serratia inhibens TaxID=2338073 RepID=UPI00321643CD
MMKVANNTANSFDLLIDEMRVHAINSLNSKNTVRFSSFTPSTDELNEFYTKTLNEGVLPDDMTKWQKGIVKELEEPQLSKCKDLAEDDENEIKHTLNKFQENKSKDLYDEKIESLRRKSLDKAEKNINEFFDKVTLMVGVADSEEESLFILMAAAAVSNIVDSIHETIREAVLLAINVVYNAIKAVLNKVKDVFLNVYKLISDQLKIIGVNA